MQQSVWPNASSSGLADNPLSLVPPLPNTSEAAISSEEQNYELILKDTYFSQTLMTLTTGFLLSGFSVELGAPNLVIGLLLAIPQLSQLLQLPGIYLVEKLRSKRQITFWGTLISRLILLPLPLIAFLPTKSFGIPALAIIYILSSSVGAMATCAWNSWMKDVLANGALGNFFSRKLSLAGVINSALTLAGGYFLELWAHTLKLPPLTGYSIMFGFGILVGLLGISPLRKMSEVQSMDTFQPIHSFQQKFIEPLRDPNYQRLIRFMFLWNFSVNLAVPFFTVYMLSVLGASMWLVTWLTIIGQIANFLMLKTWGRLIDRFCNKSVLMVCAPGLLACTLCWVILPLLDNSPAIWPAIIGIQVLLGLSMAGTTLASNNIALKLAPEGKGTPYLATNAMMSALAAGLAPLTGGLLIDLFKKWQISVALPAWPGFKQLVVIDFWNVLFLLALGLGLLSLIWLARIDETGHVRKRVVFRAIFETRKAS